MTKKYIPYTREQKIAFGKKFSKKERTSYQNGKRYGFLVGVHAPKKKVSDNDFMHHNYTKKDFDSIFDKV